MSDRIADSLWPLQKELNLGKVQNSFPSKSWPDSHTCGAATTQTTKFLTRSSVISYGLPFVRSVLAIIPSVVLVTFLFSQMALIGAWIHLFSFTSGSYSYLPSRSFAWVTLLSPYGSISPNNPKPHSKLYETETIPCLPVLGLILTTVGVMLTTCCLCFTRCRTMLLFYIKQILFLQGGYVIFAGGASALLLKHNLNVINTLMWSRMGGNSSDAEEDNLWIETQTHNQCCGIYRPSDWLHAGRTIPASCCTIKPIKPCDLSNAYPKGCYELEWRIAFKYGVFLLGTMLSMVLLQMAEYLIIKLCLHSDATTKSIQKSKNHRRIFIRQGPYFVVSDGGKASQHIIRKGGVIVETRGSLAESTALSDHHISLELMQGWGRDSVVHVTRTQDHILISVIDGNNKAGASAGEKQMKLGSAVVTSSGYPDLDKILVEPSSNGIINISI